MAADQRTRNRTRTRTNSTSNMSPSRNQSQARVNVTHAYNAIKLTNYFTNLLQQKHHHQQQQQLLMTRPIDPDRRGNANQSTTTTTTKSTGKDWRAKQLDYQIPHQDIKLLACGPGQAAATNGDKSAHQDGASDEIKFIRGQQKAASQFKASLYYLNPAMSDGPQQQESNSSSGNSSTTTKEQANNKFNKHREQHLSCFQVS